MVEEKLPRHTGARIGARPSLFSCNALRLFAQRLQTASRLRLVVPLRHNKMGSLDDRLSAMDGGDTAAAKKRRATVASGKSDLLSQMLGGASSEGGQLTREALDAPSKPRPGRSASMTMASPTSGEMPKRVNRRASSDRTSKELAVQPPPAAAAFQVPPSEELKKFKAAVLKAVEEELKALSMATSKTALAPYKPTEEGALPPTLSERLQPIFKAAGSNLLVSLEDAGAALQDAGKQAARQQLKLAQQAMEAKLEKSRVAAAIGIQQVEAVMEGDKRAFNNALSSLGVYGDEAFSYQGKLDSLHEKLGMAETRCKALEVELAQRDKTIEEMRLKEGEHDRHVHELELQRQEWNYEKSEQAREFREIQMERERLNSALMEAAAEAERAALKEAPDDLKSMVMALAKRLKDEDALARRYGGRESGDDQLKRLLGEMVDLSKAHEKLEADLRRSNSGRDLVERAVSPPIPSEIGDDLRAEVNRSQAQLTEALHHLGITTFECKTLSQFVELLLDTNDEEHRRKDMEILSLSGRVAELEGTEAHRLIAKLSAAWEECEDLLDEATGAVAGGSMSPTKRRLLVSSPSTSRGGSPQSTRPTSGGGVGTRPSPESGGKEEHALSPEESYQDEQQESSSFFETEPSNMRPGSAIRMANTDAMPKAGPDLERPSRTLRKAREVTAKFTTCMSALNKAKTDLAEVKESIKELERMLAKADERLIATKEEGKRERDALVKTALDGLSQLRGHLTVTLSALRPDPAGNYNSGEVDPPPKIKIADLIAPHVSAAAVFSPGGSGPAPVVKSWQRWKDQLGFEPHQPSTEAMLLKYSAPVAVRALNLSPRLEKHRPSMGYGSEFDAAFPSAPSRPMSARVASSGGDPASLPFAVTTPASPMHHHLAVQLPYSTPAQPATRWKSTPSPRVKSASPTKKTQRSSTVLDPDRARPTQPVELPESIVQALPGGMLPTPRALTPMSPVALKSPMIHRLP